MNIRLIGKLKAIGHILEGEGESVSSLPNPELTLTDTLGVITPDVVGGEWALPQALVGFPLAVASPSLTSPSLTASRWWTGDGWKPQVTVGFPLGRLHDNDLGPDAPAGFACASTSESSTLGVFEDETLKVALRELSFRGFITLSLSLTVGEDHPFTVTRVATDLPSHGVFNLTEACRGPLLGYILGEGLLYPSWSVNLTVSRHPWPLEVHLPSVPLGGVTLLGSSHMHFWGASRARSGWVATEGCVGVVTAWAGTLPEASRRARRTLDRLELKDKQYRSDLTSATALTLHQARGRGII